MLKKVEGLRHKHFGGALPAEGFARAGVELPGNGIKLGLRKSGEVSALGEILAEQPVGGVLVDTAWSVPYCSQSVAALAVMFFVFVCIKFS